MEGMSKSATCFIKLNTKGCCFLCLASINKNEENKPETNFESNSLQSLLCFLGISPGSLIGRLTNSNELKIDKIQVDLCHSCKEFQSRLSIVYRQLQEVQLEMDYVLERIRNCILKSTENGELVQNYSKKMTSDAEALAQLAFVDILRKEIARKSLEKQFLPSPSVILNRICSNSCKDVVIKQEQAEVDSIETEENQDNLFEDVWNDFDGPSTCMEEISQSPLSNVETSEKKVETVAYANASSTAQEEGQKEMQTTDPNNPTMESYLRSQFLCNSYNKGYDALSSLQNHQGLVHSNANGFPCHLCEKKFKQKPYLTDHVNSVHLGKRFYCQFCNKMYWHQCTVRTHEKNCPKNRKNTSFKGVYYRKDATTGLFHCLECETKSDKAAIVKQHFESVHLRIKYKCKICKVAEFSNFKSLTEHKRQGTCRRPPPVPRPKKPKETNFPFNCNKCEKRFSSLKNLSYHETSVHKNVGRYPCDLCDKKFKRTGHLKDHVDAVHLNKTFPCRYCNELYKAGGAFRKHEVSCPQRNKTTVKVEVDGSQE